MKGSRYNSIEDSDRSASKWATISSALGSWPRTIRLCVICLTMAVCSGLIWALAYLAARAIAGP